MQANTHQPLSAPLQTPDASNQAMANLLAMQMLAQQTTNPFAVQQRFYPHPGLSYPFMPGPRSTSSSIETLPHRGMAPRNNAPQQPAHPELPLDNARQPTIASEAPVTGPSCDGRPTLLMAGGMNGMLLPPYPAYQWPYLGSTPFMYPFAQVPFIPAAPGANVFSASLPGVAASHRDSPAHSTQVELPSMDQNTAIIVLAAMLQRRDGQTYSQVINDLGEQKVSAVVTCRIQLLTILTDWGRDRRYVGKLLP